MDISTNKDLKLEKPSQHGDGTTLTMASPNAGVEIWMFVWMRV